MVLLRFTKLTDKVRKGEKRQTIRLPRKNPIKLGDTLQVYVLEKLGEAKVINIERKKLKDITMEDTLKDGFSSPTILKHIIKSMHKCKIDQEVDIISFDPDWIPNQSLTQDEERKKRRKEKLKELLI